MVLRLAASTCNVLFVCRSNGARSLMAEALINARFDGSFAACSAGLAPRSGTLPLVAATLQSHGLPASGLRTKGVWEFNRPEAPIFDLVITTGDDAELDASPTLPGRPVYAGWRIPDPEAGPDDPKHRRERLEASFQLIRRCIDLFASLPMEMLERLAIEESNGLDLDETTISMLSETLRPGASI
ncbi:arsenate reductase ArsC [Microbaculum marinum]|uniref:Arsenate reductase ArsC n=1 Tax=Microbaculum marinum TaxID=1764581 RepID=A0AAW9RW41_9HYPH